MHAEVLHEARLAEPKLTAIFKEHAAMNINFKRRARREWLIYWQNRVLSLSA
jgi:hypothetical protein